MMMKRIFLFLLIITFLFSTVCIRPSILVVGGSGRVGGSAARALFDRFESKYDLCIGGRNINNWEIYCSQKGIHPSNYHWKTVDILNENSINDCIGEFDLIIHTAGPFQGLREPLLLQEALKRGKRYIDVCDDIELSRIARSDRFQSIAQKHGGTAVISTGIWPGVSSILAKEVSSILLEEGETIQKLDFSFFTAGSGGAGPTILTATFLILGENVLTYLDGEPVYLKSGSESKEVDFGPEIGRREVIAMNLIECESSFQSKIAPSVSTKFGTAPNYWNTLFKLMTQIIPQSLLQNRDLMSKFALFSLPLVRTVDNLVGAANGIRVDFVCKSGKTRTALLTHRNLEDCVGEAIASFADEMLNAKDIPSGVLFPEELPKISRRNILKKSVESSLYYSIDYR